MSNKLSNLMMSPLLKSALIHLVMFGLLLVSFNPSISEESLDIQVRAAPIIKATAVSSKDIKELVQQKQDKINAAAKAERDRKKRIKKAADRKKKAAQDKKRKKLAADKKRKTDADKKKRDKITADKKRTEDLENKRKADADKKRKADEERLRKESEERALQAQVEAELNAAREQRVLTELQKYVALIKNKISRNWIVGSQSGKCRLEVRLAAGGLVIDVIELSGEVAICRSAKAAVYRADPLPVSKDPAVFNKMRTIRFDLDPKDLKN